MYGLRFAILVLAALAILSCSQSPDADGYYRVRHYDDPFALPYRFDVLKKKTIPPGMPGSTSDRYYPFDIHGDGQIGLYVVGNNWLPRDSISCVIFYSSVEQTGPLTQINIKTPLISSHYAYDFDHDSIQELAVTYTTHDTLWLEILDIYETRIFQRPLVAGVDLNQSGQWDGSGHICTAKDITGDGYEELLVFCGVDYDLYPRKLMCVDWYRDRIYWEFEIAGTISRKSTFILPSTDSTGISIILGISSKGNAARTELMDDRHSYVVCLDENGGLRWMRETGGVFTGGSAVIFDYGADGNPDILKTYENDENTDSTGFLPPGHGALVLDRAGRLIDTLTLDPEAKAGNLAVFDLDNDGRDEILLTTSANAIFVCDSDLELCRKYRFPWPATLLDHRDYLGLGKPQLLAATDAGTTMLLSSKFDMLAQFPDCPAPAQASPYISPGKPNRYDLILADAQGSVNFWIVFSKNPWNSIFFRNPFLAFLAAFLPMAILVIVVGYYTFKIRRKNRIIVQRGKQLHAAMQELRETQEKLVAAEKYKQAKDIAGGFAHEIRNALFPARGTLTRLTGPARDPSPSPEELAEYGAIINDSITRAVDLTTLISQYTKLDADYRPESADLADLVNEVLSSKRVILADRKIDVQVDGPSGVMVRHNRAQLYRVLDNLLLNSLDALTNRIKPTIFIMWKQDKHLVRLRLVDNGCGIQHEDVGRIFDTFYSTKPDKGTGLGLAIAKKIIEMYGGTITVSSEQGIGTTFDIELEYDSDR